MQQHDVRIIFFFSNDEIIFDGPTHIHTLIQTARIK